jgi:hypothetical protein
MYKAISAGLLAIGLLTTLSCQSKYRVGVQDTGRDLLIGIITDDDDPKQCDIDFPSQNIRKKAHDQLRWYSIDKKLYQVVFATTPFEDSQHHPRFTFDVPSTAAGVGSGEPVRGAPGQYFAYGIKNDKGKVCKDPASDDPGVHIKP